MVVEEEINNEEVSNEEENEDVNEEVNKEVNEEDPNQENYREDNKEDSGEYTNEMENELADGAGMDYLLFLILLLLLVGNQNTFNQYFQLFDEQTQKMKEVLDVFSATADGLKNAVLAPQKMLDE